MRIFLSRFILIFLIIINSNAQKNQPIIETFIPNFPANGFMNVDKDGNLYVSEIETPRSDAGTGVLLLGDGDGGFSTINKGTNGFFASGDAKKIIKMKINNTETIVVANNNDTLQLFEWNTKR